MPKIKILYTIPNFKTAGSQNVLLSLFKSVDRALFEPYICVEKFPELIPDDVSIDRRLMFKWTGNKVQDLLNFKSLLKKNKIDIVHSWDYKSNFLEALASKLAGVHYLYTKKNNGWSKRWKLKSLFATHIAYDNPEMRERFFNRVSFRNKISFIPHGVDIKIFKPIKKIASKTFNIACIGNICSNKNQLFVIKAIKDLPENVILHLYGKEEKEYKKKIDTYINSNDLKDRVYLHGYLDNKVISEVYRKIDLFILASFQEGMPVTILEAMSCGIPVLSSDSGGGTKFLLKDGGGYIFDLKDSQDLTTYVRRLIQNPEEMLSLSTLGRLNAEMNFALKNEIEDYEELYQKIMK